MQYSRVYFMVLDTTRHQEWEGTEMQTGTLRQLLDRNKTLIVPGAYDALSARIAAQAGFEAVYMTGFGVAGSTLGVPDIGLLTATEMADRARALTEAAAPVPLIADGDNGHGSELNVARMVRLYEAAGVACIQLEDQVFPKRCGHMASKEVVSLAEATAKIEAAVKARRSDDFLIMARTDARAVISMDEALRRGEAFLKSGADILFVEAPQSLEELRLVAETFKGARLVANMVEDGKTPYLARDELERMGFAVALYPVSSLLVTAQCLRSTYSSMLSDGKLPEDAARLRFGEYNSMIGLHQLVPSAVAE
ncbi:isocitrate lyase/PEP mutase family protein [Fluviibacterium sp. DFM31]|uniref:Isocitrate lyase/PEP mutase family protein n=1 Tax=Meridianimarinicoccus marinus TaxID=3231483 RepID=A0ABV3LBJ6_9RHOB